MVGVGIGYTQPPQGSHFSGLHIGSALLSVVIVSEEVEEAMDNKMGEVMLEFEGALARLATNRLLRKNDVAERQPCRGPRFRAAREGEHIGRSVDPSPLAIEAAHMIVVREEHRDLGVVDDP